MSEAYYYLNGIEHTLNGTTIWLCRFSFIFSFFSLSLSHSLLVAFRPFVEALSAARIGRDTIKGTKKKITFILWDMEYFLQFPNTTTSLPSPPPLKTNTTATNDDNAFRMKSFVRIHNSSTAYRHNCCLLFVSISQRFSCLFCCLAFILSIIIAQIYSEWVSGLTIFLSTYYFHLLSTVSSVRWFLFFCFHFLFIVEYWNNSKDFLFVMFLLLLHISRYA